MKNMAVWPDSLKPAICGGATNEKLYCLSELMMSPPSINRIIDDLLHPMGMIHKEDFAFAYEY
jgi:hypothetical protein